jgi:hypothetical protein
MLLLIFETSNRSKCVIRENMRCSESYRPSAYLLSIRRFTGMIGRIGMMLAIGTLMLGVARAENTVWISASTPSVKVSKSGMTYKFETAKSTWYVKQGDRLPAHLQTEPGKVLRAGVKPSTKGGKP